MATRTRRCDHCLLAVHDQRPRDRHQLKNVTRRPCQHRSCLGQHQSERCTAEIVETRVAIQAMTPMTISDPANEIEIDSRAAGNIVSSLRGEAKSCTADGEAETLRRHHIGCVVPVAVSSLRSLLQLGR